MNMKRSKILITDHDLNFLEIADQKLSDRGFKVITSSSILESIEFLKTITVEYVLVLNNEDKQLITNFIPTLKKKPIVIHDNLENLLTKQQENFLTIN